MLAELLTYSTAERPRSSIARTVAPTTEPVSLDECLNYLRVAEPDDAGTVEALIPVAREMVEMFTGRALMSQQFTYTASGWPTGCGFYGRMIELARTPLASVQSVRYYPADGGALATLSSSDYVVMTSTEPGYLCRFDTASWPALASRPDAVQIAFTAGYASAALVPATLRQAVLLLVGHLYELRTPVNVGNIVNELPFSVRHLLESHRVGGWCA